MSASSSLSRPWRTLLFVVLAISLSACQSINYYQHAVKGQWQMISQRQSIDKLLIQTPSPQLQHKLQTIQKIRDFAQQLALPTRGQYDTYVDIKRPYAMWSLSATPELSLQLKTWCYWFFGCLSYRSYFDVQLAQADEQRLISQGYETYISNVSAFSTLGMFRDSVLSSQLQKSELELAELIFHELAHQVVYADNDPVFNESFAEVVAMEGLKRFLADKPALYAQHQRHKYKQQQFVTLVLDYRRQLAKLYQSDLTADSKRQHKQELLQQLRQGYEQLKGTQWQGYTGYDAWFTTLNNPKLNSVAIYNALIPALTALLAAEDYDLVKFYQRCQRLAALPKKQRDYILNLSI
ncbi:aminopeptidase [Agitococcus lubricus]|uniref:Putative aminopeptidase n=1 Tax=Agitococcus lubricus TaxID=1077255 RepID=A0A2T5IVG8_9GAMM|nr:aminopeptidase [Agitococcus lubricus]PTQ87892.1 putative aminopeptidase [Agitococcus lubricus]